MTATKGTKPDTRQRIDYSEAEQLLRQGKTQVEVAEHFGVSKSAVAVAVHRGRIKYDPVNRAERRAVPWVVRDEHQNKYLIRMLRAKRRADEGLGNAQPMDRMLKSFLASMEREDAVIHYNPELEEAFIRVRRRPGIDDHPLIRRDDLDDDGNPVSPTVSGFAADWTWD